MYALGDKRKGISVFIIFMLLITLIFPVTTPVYGLETSGATIKVDNVNVFEDGTGRFGVTAEQVPDPGLAGYNFEINYDPSKIKPGFVESTDFAEPIANLSIPGKILINSAQTIGNSGNLKLFDVYFISIGNNGETSPITLNVIDFTGPDLEDIPYTSQNGSVSIVPATQAGPYVEGITNYGSNKISINFDQEIMNVVGQQNAFKVWDDNFDSYEVTGTQAGNLPNKLELLVSDITDVTGVLHLFYDANVGNIVNTDNQEIVLNKASFTPYWGARIIGVENTSSQDIIIFFDKSLNPFNDQPQAFRVYDEAVPANEYQVYSAIPGNNANQINLNVTDFTNAVGNLHIQYDRDLGNITDITGIELRVGASFTPELNIGVPNVEGIVGNGSDIIVIRFDQEIVIPSETQVQAFTVTDDNSVSYGVTEVRLGQTSSELELVVSDYTNASGDLHIAYDQEIGNIVGISEVEIYIDPNTSGVFTPYRGPKLIGIKNIGNDEIILKFDRDLSSFQNQSSAFRVFSDSVDYPVISALPGIQANEIRLTVSNFASAVNGLDIDYNPNIGSITDTSGVALHMGVRHFMPYFGPMVISMKNDGPTNIIVNFDRQVLDIANEQDAFLVYQEDNASIKYHVNSIGYDGTDQSSIVLNVADFSGVSGKLRVEYIRDNGNITDGLGNELRLYGSFTPKFNPRVKGIWNEGTQIIKIKFDQEILNVEAQEQAFSVKDDAQNTFSVLQTQAGFSQDEIELIVTDFSTAVGDLHISYDASIGDVENGNGLEIALETGSFYPYFGANIVDIFNPSATEIIIKFDKNLKPFGDEKLAFRVTDENGNEYKVISSIQVEGFPDEIKLTTDQFSNAVGRLFISYDPSVGNILDTNDIELKMAAFKLHSNVYITNVSTNNTDTVAVTFSQALQSTVIDLAAFSVEDDLGNELVINSAALNTNLDQLTLTLADFSTINGYLHLYYDFEIGDLVDTQGLKLSSFYRKIPLSVVTPTPITNFITTGNDDRTASFSWTAPIGAANQYIEQSTDDGITWSNSSLENGSLLPTSSSATVIGLLPGTTYKFRLMVTGGQNAGQSNITSVTTTSLPALKVELGSSEGFKGKNVTVELKLSDVVAAVPTGITVLNFKNISYDNTKFEIVSVTKGSLITDGAQFLAYPSKSSEIAANTGSISLLISDPTQELNLITSDGIIANITFRIKDSVEEGSYPINFSTVVGDNSISQIGPAYPIPVNNFVLTNGTIEVNNFTYGDLDGSSIIDASDYGIFQAYLLNRITEFPNGVPLQAGDLDYNGVDVIVDASDYGIFQAYMLNRITIFPAEQ